MKNMKIETLRVGMCATNCYLVYQRDTKEAVIIDPGDQPGLIIARCRELELSPGAILLTHGHFDHMMAVPQVKQEFSIPVYAGKGETRILENADLNLSGMWASPIRIKADHLLREGDELELAGFSMEILETPGHTEGGICYYIPDEAVLFSGDTLFCNSYGRTDFPTGSLSELAHSIQKKLLVLPEKTDVFPGHEEPTEIGYEKKYNPLA